MVRIYCKPAAEASGKFSAFTRRGRAMGLPEEMHRVSGHTQVQSKQVTENSLEAKKSF